MIPQSHIANHTCTCYEIPSEEKHNTTSYRTNMCLIKNYEVFWGEWIMTFG